MESGHGPDLGAMWQVYRAAYSMRHAGLATSTLATAYSPLPKVGLGTLKLLVEGVTYCRRPTVPEMTA